MLKVLVALSLFLGLTFAQSNPITDILSGGAVEWLTAIGAICFGGNWLARRGTALILERSWAGWFTKSDRPILLSVAISTLYTFFIFQPQVLAAAEVLRFLPVWQTMLFIVIGSVVGSSGGYDSDKRIAVRAASGALENSLFINSVNRASPVWQTPIGIFVIGLVSRAVPKPLLAVALNILEGVVKEYMQFDFTKELQIKVTAEVHRVLRGAGLIKSTSIPKSMVSLWITLWITLSLVSCDLPAVVAPIGNGATADGANLSYSGTGVSFDPGEVDAVNVVVDIQGENVATDETSCTHEAFSVSCTAELVKANESWDLTFSCDPCSAFATFFRAGSLEPHAVLP